MATRLFKVGFATTDTPGDVQYMSCSPGSANHYDSYQQGGTAFQVTSGKTLYIGTLTISPQSSGAAAIWLYTSTASVSDSASAPTGNTACGKADGDGYGSNNTTSATTTNFTTVFNTLITVTQNRFFNAKANTNNLWTSAIGLMF